MKRKRKNAAGRKLKKEKAPKKIFAARKKTQKKKEVKTVRSNVASRKTAAKRIAAPTRKVARKPVKIQAVKKTAKAGKAKKTFSRKAVPQQGFEPDFSTTPFFKAKIRVIGIGGGGGSIVSEIGRSLEKVTFVVADTDVRAFKKRKGIKFFLFGQEFTRGLGTGLNPDIGRAAAEKEKEKISKLFEGQDIVIFISSLGGGLGSGATQVFVDAAKNFGGITFGIFTLPFRFEGKNKQNIAVRSLRELRRELNVSLTIPNERIFKIINEDTPITEAFSLVNKKLVESLESLIDLIYTPGVINIDFADLRTILKGQGNLAFLNTAEEMGKDRADKIIEKILHNPLYQQQNFTVEKVLFNIVAGSNLGMFEVDRISRAIAEKSPRAKIIFGISKSPRPTNKVKTTLLMTGPPIGEEGAAKEEAPAAVAEPVVAVKKEAKPARVPKLKKKPKKSEGKKETKGKEKKNGKATSVSPPRERESLVPLEPLVPAFNVPSIGFQDEVRRLEIVDPSSLPKKTIRRSALEVKKHQESEEQRKSQQEKEWEIPAFLRKIKFKP